MESLPYLPHPMRTLRQGVIHEKSAPELLPYLSEEIEFFREKLGEQSDSMEEMSEKGKDLIAHIMDVEMERIQYLLAEYHRVRLRKIEKFCFYLLSDEEPFSFLSPLEQQFARRYAEVARSHFRRSALDHIPDRYREVGVSSEMEDSIVRPNLDTHVFVYPLEDIGPIAITPESTDYLRQDYLYVVRYRVIRDFLLEHRVVLV
eukprot:TRINITY_DN25992_c0_g1_i1.p1 TRINITY_DN25992_c0_g1~~TRINITY_DN25992_c0_g1_i1.p1  ORF type:complete len:219 (-),score=44.82 TRINITY_DN25992_c0_g1_i1:42-650(-)